MTKVASFRVQDKYVLNLYQQPKQVRFNLAGQIETPTWTLLSLEATDLKTKKSRRVWAIYYAWDPSVHKSGLHQFTFSARSDHVVGLAFLVGTKMPRVNFYEIDLTQTDEEKIPDQPLRPGAAYAATASLLRSSQARHIIWALSALKQAYGEEKANALFAENDLEIKDVAWTNGHWNVTLALGKKQFTFVREKADGTWQWKTDK